MTHRSDYSLSRSPLGEDKRRKAATQYVPDPLASSRGTQDEDQGTSRIIVVAAVALITLILSACSGPSTEPGNAERGKALFNAPVQSSRGELEPCSACHAIVDGQKSRTGLGTNFHDIGARAGNTVKGQSAEQYLRTSIVDPDAYLAGNFQDGLMSREYGKLLTPQQIEDLVAYMLTLK
jgi:cytochrome c553